MKSKFVRAGLLLSVFCVLLACQQSAEIKHINPTVTTAVAHFNWFEYKGKDEIFAQPLDNGQYQNPIVAGYYPDPSITRKGDDFYMVHSSFGYAPGVPVLHSRDLVHWKLIGHVLDRPSQLKLDGLRVSEGIFAPTIRYHDGLFYMITTAVASGGNFMVTATDPAGPWSEPIWLPEIGGIDPDIFFDDDGKVYIAHNDAPDGEPLYQGHRVIRLWEFDLATNKVVTGNGSGRVIDNGGVDISAKPVWIEGPHIYKINGWYYLSCAEGGTSVDHSQVVFRSKNLSEPFVPYAHNPILTQRDLDPARSHPVTSTGHADFIQTPSGQWWSVFLATRPYQDNLYNTGRETYLLPVSWQNDWPVILAKGQSVPYRPEQPQVAETVVPLKYSDEMTGNFTWRDEFDTSSLNPHWNLLRGFDQSWFKLQSGQLIMQALDKDLSVREQVAFIGHRQQHMTFSVSTSLILTDNAQMSAGLVAFQNDQFHYYFAAQRIDAGYRLFVQQVNNAESKLVAEQTIEAQPGDELILIMDGDKGLISFAYQATDGPKTSVLQDADASLLSTDQAGGFVGTMLGLHSRTEQ